MPVSCVFQQHQRNQSHAVHTQHALRTGAADRLLPLETLQTGSVSRTRTLFLVSPSFQQVAHVPTDSSPLAPPSGALEKYMDGRWQKISAEDSLKITKLDGQVWISLFNLLLKEDCQRKYDFNNFNKNKILKVCT